MNSNDQPMAACEPVCDFEQDEGGIAICPTCGTLWHRQQVTEVDPVTFQPTHIGPGWVSR